ncbi:hypothetical protein GJ496_002141 [Pomphorhynchus laevis]|nr:hypothetical protein GJ496_002141 [Pomphorhynchus laevis]
MHLRKQMLQYDNSRSSGILPSTDSDISIGCGCSDGNAGVVGRNADYISFVGDNCGLAHTNQYIQQGKYFDPHCDQVNGTAFGSLQYLPFNSLNCQQLNNGTPSSSYFEMATAAIQSNTPIYSDTLQPYSLAHVNGFCYDAYSNGLYCTNGIRDDYETSLLEFNGFDLSDPRCFRRRISANKKERRRTQSINNAFSHLRECIPNVPVDTKLSKIKTLRLATKYIEFLMQILECEDGAQKTIHDFKAEIGRTKKRVATSSIEKSCNVSKPKKFRCRTGWPQDVWVNELNGH